MVIKINVAFVNFARVNWQFIHCVLRNNLIHNLQQLLTF